jgi:sulfhydrogenase subunit beta (sulfur reductase)
MAKKLNEQTLSNWLQTIAEQGLLYGPQANGIRWGKISDYASLGNAFANTLSPKEVLLPQDQTMFLFDRTKPIESFAEKFGDAADGSVLWGIHPCDARALELVHRVYNEKDYKDPYLAKIWNKLIRVAVGCANPPSTCFCTSFDGGSPFGTQGVDILATKLDGDWILEPITQKAESLLSRFPDSDDDDIKRLAQIKKIATTAVDSTVPTGGIAEKLWSKFNDDEFWFEIGARCLGCGICTFVCPDCYCFDIADEHIDKKARRFRTWDGCQYTAFTLEASGHNPRPTQKHRIRQRMMHKLSFFAKRYDGTQLCVGCGRCVRECPVNIDIREVAKKVL